MARAGQSTARLALALYPHARIIWVACGPGNNGGDGLVAARHLHLAALAHGGRPRVVVTHWLGDSGDESRLPDDARHALAQARDAGVVFVEQPPASHDLAIDAVLGLGATRPAQGRLGEWLTQLRRSPSPVLCVDLPSGLDADTGLLSPVPGAEQAGAHSAPGPRHTLTLLTLKPGLFTANGRDAAGDVWFDDLGAQRQPSEDATAWLSGQPGPTPGARGRPHASHKGSFGDVVVLGGQSIGVDGAGMTGAAVLAARAALHAGAGRVFVGLLQANEAAADVAWDPVNPELMFRRPERLLDALAKTVGSVVCGCGGGSSVAAILPRVLSTAHSLVLDADALNAIAQDTVLQTLLRHRAGRGAITVITPHPLEAARLLGQDTNAVMADRISAAQALADRHGVVCVLKGSGTVMAAPARTPLINPSGNAALATAGTGDVLAGMIGSALARPRSPQTPALDVVASAVFQHGWLADHWPADGPDLCASALAASVRYL
ncbi:MAG: NAD(P)H-hydrate dehydratase [Hydrogenophaga sp.]|nr:NAD(P)H-hydrate dehydratase [Hydrogenophaga sp.]